ncbi:MAG: hypothetical protein AAGU19_17100 [Prolixibacteraceae bacterium]
MENFNDAATDRNIIELDHIGLLNLKETRKWTMLLSVLGFVFIGLMLALVIWLTLMGGSPYAVPQVFSFIPLLLLCVIYFFPIYFLFQFSRYSRLAIANSNSNLLSKSLRYLKKHYQFMGILAIIVLIIYALMIPLMFWSSGLLKTFVQP